MIDTTGTQPPATSTRRPWFARARLAATSLVLAGGLALAGCAAATSAADVETVSTTATSTTGTTSESTTSGSTAETISDTAAAAKAFLATLNEEQQEAVLYDYDDETKTTSWTNFPVTFVDRAGLNLADLTEEQQQAALAVLETLLSEEAYATVEGIMGGDAYLNEYSSTTEDSLGQYYIALFGDPSDTKAWSLQFGGHHLGVNADLNGAEETLTFAPTHLGVQPAVYTNDDGEEVQPFDEIYTDAFAFYDSLTTDQQETLTSGDVTMCSPGDTCDFTTGAGLSGSDLTEEQREALLELIANWAGMAADDESNEAALAEIEATLDDTVIAWSGETTYDMSTGEGISFSISGPNVYLAFQAQQGSAGADVDGVTTSGWGHVHTIYRDPTNDYGGSVTQQAASGMSGGPAGDGAGGDGEVGPSF
ncbi:DUF3500 domain-containing protein [Citricoccus sp. NR2]|uniref:DUF3500 domain-containing protein n=1 Tax=Citricoccus sp. NR2 TaxID=3004095 RepID=UPI0022DE333A|nr:DUF3500 domain-containing protein [Citricoccus sp. NR2]WBL19819.1 DUF3500 domain-containing protein [Citricoccus sp. NR2]